MNRINRLLIASFVLVVSQTTSAIVVTGYAGNNSAGGGVPVNWTGTVYDRTEDEAKKAAAEAAAKAEKEARQKSRDECLTREAAQIAVDKQTCKLPFDTQYKSDLQSCFTSSNVSQCNLVADARRTEGYNICERDAAQRLTNLPSAYVCQR